MHSRTHGGPWLAATVMISLSFASPTAFAAAAGDEGGGGGQPGDNTGALYSDLVVTLRAADGTPLLKEYAVPGEDPADPAIIEYCVQPVSYGAVPGVSAITNPLDGRPVWVLPLQGEWIDNPVDPLPVEEIEACDPKPQYAMFAVESELERLNLTRTSESVLERKKADVATKLTLAETIGLDPAGRLTVDGAALDAAPEYAGIYDSLMMTGAIAGLDFADVPYDRWQLAAVAIGAAASKGVPITVDTVQYYNRIVGFTNLEDPPTWPGLSFVTPTDPNPATPMPIDVLPGGENFVDYGDFTYTRSETFIGSLTWLDVATLKWHVDPIIDTVPWTNLQDTSGLTKEQVDGRTLTGVTAFAQMADDARAVINYLHEHDQIVPGFYMDPVLVDTTAQQVKNTTDPAVQLVAPDDAFQTLPFQASASVYNPWGGALIDEARLRVTIDAPDALVADDVTATAPDGAVPLTVDGDGDLVGWWGPAEGIEMALGYRADTPFTVTVSGAAQAAPYVVGVELVDVDEPGTILAEDTSTVNVHPDSMSVLWGGDIPVLGTQGTYYTVPVRAYAPVEQDAVLTLTLTGPGDDEGTALLEELEAGEAKVYGSNGTDMAPMALSLTAQDELSAAWPTSLGDGYSDLVWYLMVNEGAPVGQYGIDVGIQGGTDLAEPAYVSFAAPETHGQQPPDAGEDTTAPAVVITLDAITTDSASFSFVANEDSVTFKTQLTTAGVKGPWEDSATGTKSYSGLQPGDYVFAVKATDASGNSATYIKKFTVKVPLVVPTTPTPTTPTTPNSTTPGEPSTWVVSGPDNRAWVLDEDVTFVLGSDAADSTYDVRLNGGRFESQAGDTVTVKGLQPGVNRIRFRARTSGGVDTTPVVRTVYLPRGVRSATWTRAWTMLHHGDAFLNTFLSTSRSGQYVSVFAPRVRQIALVVTTGPRSGKVHVYLGSRRLTDTPISLRSRKVLREQLVLVHRFAQAQRGQVRVVAVGGGRVRIEGIGIAGR